MKNLKVKMMVLGLLKRIRIYKYKTNKMMILETLEISMKILKTRKMMVLEILVNSIMKKLQPKKTMDLEILGNSIMNKQKKCMMTALVILTIKMKKNRLKEKENNFRSFKIRTLVKRSRKM
jgi:hypothetical protein